MDEPDFPALPLICPAVRATSARMVRLEADESKALRSRLAFAAAVVLHAILLLAGSLIWLQSPPRSGGVQSVAIRLSGPPGDGGNSSSEEGRRVSEASRLDDLQRRLAAPSSTSKVHPAGASTSELPNLMDGGASDTTATRGGETAGDDAGDPYGRASFDQAAAGTRVARDRIAHQASGCLSPPGKGEPVWLEVRLRRDGRLAKPVLVILPAGGLAPAKTAAETRAIEAVTRCAPYKSALGSSAILTHRIALRGAVY